MEVLNDPPPSTLKGTNPTSSGGRCDGFTRLLVRQQHRGASDWKSPHMSQGFHGSAITP